ncbi:MAG: type II toxin-antitoxin system MqsA family antitoxin [Fimbriimonadaceae bacterium]|nr:type II toxin-antitoxin system MqsA family antitoxin [Fimbriimonadaceae bacterium]
MTCLICKNGQTVAGMTTITLERGQTTIVFKGVPAQVCETCGEVYVNGDDSQKLLDAANAAALAGVQVEVRAYAA